MRQPAAAPERAFADAAEGFRQNKPGDLAVRGKGVGCNDGDSFRHMHLSQATSARHQNTSHNAQAGGSVPAFSVLARCAICGFPGILTFHTLRSFHGISAFYAGCTLSAVTVARAIFPFSAITPFRSICGFHALHPLKRQFPHPFQGIRVFQFQGNTAKESFLSNGSNILP